MATNYSNNKQTSNLLSWLMYALIALFVLLIGYKAYQIQKTNNALKAESDQINAALRENGELGFVDTDSTGTSYVSGSGVDGPATYPDAATEGTTVKSDAAVAPTTNSVNTTAKGSKMAGIEGDQASSSVTLEQDEEGVPVKVRDLDMEDGNPSKAKYMVITGSFRKLMGARAAMETLVKKGYAEAEVGKFNRGTYACAIAYRTSNLEEARAVATRLRKQGFVDTFVKERK